MSNKNKKRGFLNQIIDEPEVEKNEVVEQEALIVDLKAEAPEVEKEIPTPEEEVQIFAEDIVPPQGEPVEEPCVCTEPCTEPCVCEESIPEIVDEVAKFVNDSIIEELKVLAPRDISSLSQDELRSFRRTGVLPQ